MHAAAPAPPPPPEHPAAELTAGVDGSPDAGGAPEHPPKPAEDALIQVPLKLYSFFSTEEPRPEHSVN